jgi:hypothetical protein
VLLAASGSDTGGAAIWPWALGGIVAAGGIAAAASSGGGGGDDDNGNNGTPTNPYPDTTPPNAPSGLQFSSDGKTVTGTAEPGSTITLKDANGNVIGTGKPAATATLPSPRTPLTNGEQVTATATDSSGNTSPGTTVTAPDTTAPDAPTIGSVTDDIGDKAGALTNGGSTNDQRPSSAAPASGLTVTIYDGGIAIGTAVVPKAPGHSPRHRSAKAPHHYRAGNRRRRQHRPGITGLHPDRRSCARQRRPLQRN